MRAGSPTIARYVVEEEEVDDGVAAGAAGAEAGAGVLAAGAAAGVVEVPGEVLDVVPRESLM